MRGLARFTKMNKMFSSGVGPSGTNTSGLFSIPTPQTPAPPGQTSSSSQFSQQPNNFLFSSQSTARPQSQSTLFGVQGSSTGSFGQQNSASQPSNSFYTQQQPIPASFNTHPFQYIQECLDPQSTNYRFRVSS